MEEKWWHNKVIYQIYPRSFMDSNGDGIGDLEGIRNKLDYLEELGVGIIWLCPVYTSPNKDNGYDISDYYGIMEEFGTMGDMYALIQDCKSHNISIMMDLVLNHSSDQHWWFLQSKSSRENPYHDYYIWAETKDGKEPTDEQAFFGGSIWEWNEPTKEYYLHSFSPEQPDLNWENPKLREELYQMIRFWMDLGIEGFRFDAIDHISKDENYHMDEKTEKVHQYIREMNCNSYGKSSNTVTVGETGSANIESAKLYSNPERHELDMIFQFELMGIDGVRAGNWEPKKYSLADLKNLMEKWQTQLDGQSWNSLFLGNHDYPRSLSRFGNTAPKYRKASAKMLGTFLHGMKGIPYIYQGDELGMINMPFQDISEYRDVESLNFYNMKLKAGWNKEKIMEYLARNSRDNGRTPMQWDDTENAGFSKKTPWIAVNPSYKEINAKECLNDPDSVFYHYKKLVQLRKEKKVMVYGNFKMLYREHPKVFAYSRNYRNEQIIVICNFTSDKTEVPQMNGLTEKNILLSNYENLMTDKNVLYLRPYEAIIFQTQEV
ncbi:MAG: alpha-glucosidase [Ruminococcus sp. SR1/5]|nr:alpha-glucosidase [Ruminococcus sp.]